MNKSCLVMGTFGFLFIFFLLKIILFVLNIIVHLSVKKMLVRYKTLFSKSFGKFVRSVKHDSSIFKLVRRNHLEIVHERFFVHFEKLSFFISLMDPSCSFIICFYVRSQNRCSSLILSNLGSRI